MNHGLSHSELEVIKKIIIENSQNIDSVGLFGSRATGLYKANSDIDLVLYGEVTEQESARLYTCFLESLLPYKVDIEAYQSITYEPFRSHIDQFARLLFTREDLYQ